MRKTKFFLTVAIVLSICVGGLHSVYANQGSILADDYPQRYVVVKGDTLWDISAKF